MISQQNMMQVWAICESFSRKSDDPDEEQVSAWQLSTGISGDKDTCPSGRSR